MDPNIYVLLYFHGESASAKIYPWVFVIAQIFPKIKSPRYLRSFIIYTSAYTTY